MYEYDDWIDIPGFPDYKLDPKTLKVVSFHYSRNGKQRSLGQNEIGVDGYRLYNNGNNRFFTLDELRGTVELQKIKLSLKEKNKMTNIAIGVPASGDYIIGSLSKMDGRLSFKEFPAKHKTLPAAKSEAARLAQSFKDKKFIIVKVESIASVSDVVWE